MTLTQYALVAILCPVASGLAFCQPASTSKNVITAAEVSRSLRDGRNTTTIIIQTLAQSGGPVDARSLQAIADSLVAIATVSARTIPDQSRRNAISALGLAGAPPKGTAYAGSARALYLIAMNPGHTNSTLAIANLAKVTAYDSVEAYLAQIAASRTSHAAEAINALHSAMLSAKRPHRELRKLWEGSTVKEPFACEQLRNLAWHNKWPPTPASSCQLPNR